MTRRRNPPSHRPPGSNRASKDRDTIDSELRAARANRKADSQQKQALRRLEWDAEMPEAEEEDTEMFEDEPTEDVPPDDETPEAKQEKPGRS